MRILTNVFLLPVLIGLIFLTGCYFYGGGENSLSENDFSEERVAAMQEDMGTA